MKLTDIPGKLVRPFADDGAKATIPVDTVVPTDPGRASLETGFPPITMQPKGAGGIPPDGSDMNGILFEMSDIDRWSNAGAGYPYDSAFATDANVNGYPKGAVVLHADGLGHWLNTVDDNTSDPDAGGAGWVPLDSAGTASITMTASNVTLTAEQYRKKIIVITGALTANLNLIFPAIASVWTIINLTTGNYRITAKTAAGTGYALPPSAAIVGDGTNIYPVTGGMSALRAASGFQYLPSGIIFQWGNNTTAGGIRDVSFPIQFPTAVRGIYPCITGANTSGTWAVIETGGVGNTGFNAYSAVFGTASGGAANGNIGFFWFAIGE